MSAISGVHCAPVSKLLSICSKLDTKKENSGLKDFIMRTKKEKKVTSET